MAISQEMRQAVRLWETVEILIVDPGSNSSNIRNKVPEAIKWHGLARRQPYRREVQAGVVTNPTNNQSVRFQIDFDADGAIPDIHKDWQIFVLPQSLTGLATPDNKMSVYLHVVSAADNSNLAWIRTIECQVNTEIRVNPGNVFQSDGSGGYEWKP
jgi:hypothetical protein